MSRTRVPLLVAVAIAGLTDAAAAQDLQDKAKQVSGEAFVRAFLGHCAQNAGNPTRTVEAAKALDFPPLPDELKPLMAPQDPKAEFEGFVALEGDGAPYFLGVSTADLDGRKFATCSVANPYIDTAKVVVALASIAELREPTEDETQMGQRYRLWFTTEWVEDSFVSLTDGEAMGLGGATLAIAAPSIE